MDKLFQKSKLCEGNFIYAYKQKTILAGKQPFPFQDAARFYTVLMPSPQIIQPDQTIVFPKVYIMNVSPFNALSQCL